MFRTMSSNGGLPSQPGREASSPGAAGQESPWTGLLSALSRPALALLQRPLHVPPGSAPPPGEQSQAGWKERLSEEERRVLRLLDDVLVAPRVAYLHCEAQEKGPRDLVLDLGGLEEHARTLLSQVWWSSEDPPQGSKTLWGSFLGGVARTNWTWDARLHSNLNQQHHLLSETKAFGGLLPAASSQNGGTWWAAGVGAGAMGRGEQQQAPPTPADQDHGYSSLEEEYLSLRWLYLEERPLQEDEQEPTTAQRSSREEEEEVKDRGAVQDEQKEQCLAPPPRCQNKSIAFIMGCPCSDDDEEEEEEEGSSQSQGPSSDADDDGFDSEGSSDLSTSDDEDDPETELLWASLSRSHDPYDPRNFTAHLHTGTSPPRAVAPPPSSSPLPLPSSPAPSSDSWDESSSASDAEEADALWAALSCSSDPYSPLNFQAPLTTRGPPTTPRGAEEPLSESLRPSSCTKKVRFCEKVEFFFASGAEDRRGPWEELARDRSRFLRRCQQVELSIGHCLQPAHRRRVYRRLVATQPPQP